MPYQSARDPLSGLASSLSSPARRVVLLVPSDVADLDPYAKALWVHVPAAVAGGGPTVRVTAVGAADGESVDLYAPPGLMPLPPFQARKVWATGTTAGVRVYALTDR